MQRLAADAPAVASVVAELDWQQASGLGLPWDGWTKPCLVEKIQAGTCQPCWPCHHAVSCCWWPCSALWDAQQCSAVTAVAVAAAVAVQPVGAAFATACSAAAAAAAAGIVAAADAAAVVAATAVVAAVGVAAAVAFEAAAAVAAVAAAAGMK